MSTPRTDTIADEIERTQPLRPSMETLEDYIVRSMKLMANNSRTLETELTAALEDNEVLKHRINNHDLELAALEHQRLTDNECLISQRDQWRECARELAAALKAWQDGYEPALDGAEADAEKFKSEGDMYGWNFYKGRWSGLVSNDIALTELKRALTTFNTLEKGQPQE